MSIIVRRFSFKPHDGSEIINVTVTELCRHVAEPLGMTDVEVEQVLALNVDQVLVIPDIGGFIRTC